MYITTSCADSARPARYSKVACGDAEHSSGAHVSLWRKYVVGGVPSIIWPWLIATAVVVSAWNVLWITGVIPPGTLINEFWVNNIVFLVGYLIVGRYNSALRRYERGLKMWAMYTATMNRACMSMSTALRTGGLAAAPLVQPEAWIKQHLTLCRAYMQAMLRVAVLDLRGCANMQLHAILDVHVLSDLRAHTSTSQLAIERVYMRLHHVVTTLETPAGTEATVSVLRASDTNRHLGEAMDVWCKLQELQNAKDPPALRVHRAVILILYFTFLFQYLYSLYNWYGIAVAVFLVYSVIGLLLASTKLEHPLQSAACNPFLWETDVDYDVSNTTHKIHSVLSDAMMVVGYTIPG